ncbi:MULTISPECIES: putative lipid II flippase FtsW [Thermodesulfovibrio]|uniref:Probable peptidoglycan glycosyltransferase FtsW n=1 Tax=Thermodesulfovibrio yellowstonii TaxID=28262 RepID=A0A9W6GG52_9BACT|nr:MULTISPECIES: putative lipid II flippase FtsW [Thermodesulfovibrio]GLI53276.1 cell division protein FtsW [Thermodesulfovibrio islandicus]
MKKGSIDKTLIIAVTILVIIGLIAVYSSTSVLASVKAKYADKGGMIYLQKQLFTLIIGFFFIVVFIFLPVTKLKKLVFPLLIISFIMLIAVFSPLGVSAGGARRWLRLWPSVFQPSELVKLAMVFFLAWYMSRESYNKESIKDFVIPISLMGVFQIIFLKQPDFGAVMTLGIITFVMLFIGGVSLRFLGLTILLAIPVLFYLAKEPYRWKRITSFLDPWSDPQGSGFQLVQSLIALGSGGLTGQGLGEGKQKLAFLPEIHTDFIFAHIGEEMGFIGVCVVVILFFFICMRGLNIAAKQIDPFCYFLASGITIMISIQALINFAVVTGLAPTKGLPLPFISYGGSSLVVNLIAVGVLLNLSRFDYKTDFTELTLQKKNKLRTYRYYYKGRKFS